MTKYGHNKVMLKKAKIADFKSRLSAYLKDVRRGGEVVIMDRYTPVARVVPITSEKKLLAVRPPVIAGGFKNFHFEVVPLAIDVVGLLREEREDK